MISLVMYVIALLAVVAGIVLIIYAQRHDADSARAVIPLFLIGWGFFALKLLFRILNEVLGIEVLDGAFSMTYSTLVMLFFIGGMYLMATHFGGRGYISEDRKV